MISEHIYLTGGTGRLMGGHENDIWCIKTHILFRCGSYSKNLVIHNYSPAYIYNISLFVHEVHILTYISIQSIKTKEARRSFSAYNI